MALSLRFAAANGGVHNDSENYEKSNKSVKIIGRRANEEKDILNREDKCRTKNDTED